MKIKKIESIGKKEVFDLTVAETNSYITENGLVHHNTGIIYSASQAFIIGKAKVEDKTQATTEEKLLGFKFTLNVEKSRFVRARAKLPFVVSFDGGVQKYSGLLEIAMKADVVRKPSMGWYSRVQEDDTIEAKKFREKDTNTEEFWTPVLNSEKFKEYCKNYYKLGKGGKPVIEDDVDYELEEENNDE